MSARGLSRPELAAVYRRLAPGRVYLSAPPEQLPRDVLLRAIRRAIATGGEHLPAGRIVHLLLPDLTLACPAAGHVFSSSDITEVNCGDCHAAHRGALAAPAGLVVAGGPAIAAAVRPADRPHLVIFERDGKVLVGTEGDL